MKRIVILALVLLAAIAGPAQARDERQFHGTTGRAGHHRPFQRAAPHRLHGHVPYRFYSYAPIYSYAPSCSWRQGYWGYQPYVDASGQGWYVPQWVPAQYLCY
jgi:hypothetical protein